MRSTFALINLSNLIYNYLNIKKKVGKTKIMAVVKADAYGHGMREIVEALNSTKSKKPDYYAVAFIEEGVTLRRLNIKQPILVFEPPSEKGDLKWITKNYLITTIFSKDHIKLLNKSSAKTKVHIKVDTGMHRVGVSYKDAFDFIREVSQTKNIQIDGICSHFATSDENDKTYANLQFKRFKDLINKLKRNKINYGITHIANSGAILDMPETYLDMVRPGICLYGYYPSLETSESINLKPVMSLISKVESINEIDKGESVSYGRKFYSRKKTKIASVPIGYADGYPRNMSNKGKAIINEKIYRQAGTVTMDRIMFNLGNDETKVGDKVTLLGKEKKHKITAWDWSEELKTIPYEITCNISKRVPRIYTY
jgi:alanine racemase